MHVECRELLIKFKDRNKHGQEIRSTQHTGADHLNVAVNDYFVTVMYVNKENIALKILAFAREDVADFMAENNVRIAE